jgi:citrate synthase
MAVEEAKPKAGLEDVVAATSAICYLDGDRGVLAYYGYDIHDLAKGATFEEVCYLLWHGRLPNRAELGDLQSQLAAARPVAEPLLRLMKQLPASDGMDMLRTLTSALGQYDPEVNDSSPQAQYRKAVRLTAQMASLVATHGRAPWRARDPRVRRRAGAARGPRAERLDVRRARGRRDAD